jgi:hypothetical protein
MRGDCKMDAAMKDKFIILLKSLPAMIPTGGKAYAHFQTEVSIDEVKGMIEVLSDLNADQHEKLFSELGNISEVKDTLNWLRNLNEKQHEILLSKFGNMAEKFELLEIVIKNKYQEYDKPNRSKITVVIPCGGKGGNLFPMTQVMPKCLVIVNNKTLLQHILDSFHKHAHLFDKVIVTTGDYHDAISHKVEQCRLGDFVECRHVQSSSVPHSLRLIRNEIASDRFLLHYNDILISDPKWEQIVDTYELHKKHHKQIGTLLCSQFYPLGIGVISAGHDGLMKDFEEKPDYLAHGKYANIAVAIFETRTIDKYCKDQDTTFFKETIKRMQDHKEPISLQQVEKWFHVQDWNALYNLQHGRLFP